MPGIRGHWYQNDNIPFRELSGSGFKTSGSCFAKASREPEFEGGLKLHASTANVLKGVQEPEKSMVYYTILF